MSNTGMTEAEVRELQQEQAFLESRKETIKGLGRPEGFEWIDRPAIVFGEDSNT